MTQHAKHNGALEQYIKGMNARSRAFGEPAIDTKRISEFERRVVVSHLEGDLSPENLECDGELTGKALEERQNYLFAVRDELNAMALGIVQ